MEKKLNVVGCGGGGGGGGGRGEEEVADDDVLPFPLVKVELLPPKSFACRLLLHRFSCRRCELRAASDEER